MIMDDAVEFRKHGITRNVEFFVSVVQLASNRTVFSFQFHKLKIRMPPVFGGLY